MGWGGWRVDRGGFVDLVLLVWLDGEVAVELPGETGLLVEDLEGRGRKSSFTMQAEVIWRLDEFDEQDEEEEEENEKGREGREVLSLQEGLAWQRAEICGVTEVDGHADELGEGAVQ